MSHRTSLPAVSPGPSCTMPKGGVDVEGISVPSLSVSVYLASQLWTTSRQFSMSRFHHHWGVPPSSDTSRIPTPFNSHRISSGSQPLRVADVPQSWKFQKQMTRRTVNRNYLQRTSKTPRVAFLKLKIPAELIRASTFRPFNLHPSTGNPKFSTLSQWHRPAIHVTQKQPGVWESIFQICINNIWTHVIIYRYWTSCQSWKDFGQIHMQKWSGPLWALKLSHSMNSPTLLTNLSTSSLKSWTVMRCSSHQPYECLLISNATCGRPLQANQQQQNGPPCTLLLINCQTWGTFLALKLKVVVTTFLQSNIAGWKLHQFLIYLIYPLRKLGWFPTILVSGWFGGALEGIHTFMLQKNVVLPISAHQNDHQNPRLFNCAPPVHSEAIHHRGKHMFRSHPEGMLPDRESQNHGGSAALSSPTVAVPTVVLSL